MKTLLFLFVAVLSFNVSANCNRQVDQNKIVLFVDTNDGRREIDTARAAACARGEKFVVIPERRPNAPVAPVSVDDIRTLMTSWKASGAKPVSMIISGHDGGGSFSGTSGSVSRAELAYLMNEEFPEMKSSIRSLYLLGCYTGVKFELFSWMNIFPELKMIAGYEGSAPLSDKRAGHNYLRSLMLQENTLMAQTSSTRLLNMINRIPDIGVLTNGLMIEAQCIDPQTNQPIDFYHRSQPESGQRFEVLNSQDCKDKISQLRDKGAEFAQYFDGATPIPTDTRNGALRQLYNFYRHAEHCYENIHGVPRGDQVLGMLFYPGYTENIARYLSTEAEALKQSINGMTLDDWKNAMEADRASYARKASEFEERFKRAEANPEAAFNQAKARNEEIDARMQALGSGEFGRQLVSFFNRNPDTAWEDLPSPPLDRNKIQEMISLTREKAELGVENAYDGNSYAQTLNYYRDAYQQRANAIEQYPKTQDAMDSWKENFWLPTRENIVGKSRTEHRQGLHTLYGAANTAIGVPANVRKRLKALSENSNKLLGNLKCLPLSWHEHTGGNLEAPTCAMASPERRSGDATVMNGIFDLPNFSEPEL